MTAPARTPARLPQPGTGEAVAPTAPAGPGGSGAPDGAVDGAVAAAAAPHPPPLGPDEPAARPDPWAGLRRHTPARLALGRAGAGMPTAEVLRLAAAHAQARDAVHLPLDAEALCRQLAAAGWAAPLAVHSQAGDRTRYLRRPDLGRRLRPADAGRLRALAASAAAQGAPAPDLVVVLGDGLSALALQRHAAALLAALREALGPVPPPAAADMADATDAAPANPAAQAAQAAPAAPAAGAPPAGATLHWAPLVLAQQARVALGDEVGEALGARLALVLIGERPGLSAPDSLGAYLTHAPRVGCHDAQRNCVSNIRPEGLPPAQAARRLAWLVRAALQRGVTGIGLKDESTALLADHATQAAGTDDPPVAAAAQPPARRPPSA